MKAIIIGATSGIGMETALLLHAEGWTVGLAGRRTERLDLLQAQLGERVYTRQIDVCSEEAPAALQALIREMGDDIDLIFLSSGIGWQNARLDKTTSDEQDVELLTVETNALGFTRMITTAYRYFATRCAKCQSTDGHRPHGHIAAISSIAGTKGLGAAPAYSATKRFQNHYIQCLAQQARMNGYDIRFTDIRPGFVATDLIAGSNFPLQLDAKRVARAIVRALLKKKRKVIIDWRYAILVNLWRCLPDRLWERMKVK